MDSFVQSLNRVLAVQNYGTCGTKFFHSLLDDHPNILAMPSIYMISFYRFWPTDIERDLESTIEEFIKLHSWWFDPKGYAPWGTDKMGPNRNESVYVERDLFVQNLRAAMDHRKVVSRRLFFQSLYAAYAASIGRSLNLDAQQYIMLYPFHTGRPEWAAEMVRDFSDTRFVHCFREPIQNFGSSFKLFVTRWAGFVPKCSCTTALVPLYQLLLDTFIADPHPYTVHGFSPILPDYKIRSRVIRLEDLHRHPAETLNKLCAWLDIPWDDALLKSTYNGKMWWNRPESVQVSGFSEKPISRTHDDIISKVDRYRLEILLSRLKAKMGYPSVSWRATAINKLLFFALLLLPLKAEIVSVFPSRFSLPETFQLIRRFPERIKAIASARSLRGTRVGAAVMELWSFFIGWLMLVPFRSYVKGRVGLFRAWKQLSDKELEVVDIL